jgi:hypothetical protein
MLQPVFSVMWDPKKPPHKTPVVEKQPVSFDIIGEWSGGAKSIFEIKFTPVDGIVVEPATITFDPSQHEMLRAVKTVEVTVLRKPEDHFEIKTGESEVVGAISLSCLFIHRLNYPACARHTC